MTSWTEDDLTTLNATTYNTSPFQERAPSQYSWNGGGDSPNAPTEVPIGNDIWFTMFLALIYILIKTRTQKG